MYCDPMEARGAPSSSSKRTEAAGRRAPQTDRIAFARDEFVPLEASNWYGIGAPRSTPIEIIDQLNKSINVGLADPRLKVQIANLGGAPTPGSPTDFGKLIANETEKWGKVIRSANIKAE
jgi:tripartite-type tricarboxylate transporter receptor subunit TctC